MPFDLFISYARRDDHQGRITRLIERLREDFARATARDLAVFLDHQAISGMADWRQRILQGLRESRLLVACLTPAYLQSPHCEWEVEEYLKYEIAHAHGYNGLAPVYLAEVPGWADTIPEDRWPAWVTELRRRQHIDLRLWHEHGEESLQDATVREQLGQLCRDLARIIVRGDRAANCPGNVEAPNPHFVDRRESLRQLRDHFVTPGRIGAITAVHGVGGLGKTALATEYAHAYADEYGGGRWQVRCAGKGDLRLALAELATSLELEFTDLERENPDLQFDRVLRELKRLSDAREPHRCLLLLDNVDKASLLDPAQVARLDAGDWLHVLATTRLGESELHGTHRDRRFVGIDELPPEDALALIESYQPGGRILANAEREAAREIVHRLGGFTLAVESVAVFLGEFAHDVTCAAFLSRLEREGLEGLEQAATRSGEGIRHGEKRFGATLLPTLERLEPPQRLALDAAALLPPDQVPLLWLREVVSRTFPEMGRDSDPGYPDPWKSVVRRLLSLRLFQPGAISADNPQLRIIRVHRLIQELCRSRMSDGGEGVRAALMPIIESACSTAYHLHTRLSHRWLVPVLESTADCWLRRVQCGEVALARDAIHVANAASGPLMDHTAWNRAEDLLRRSLQIAESIPGVSRAAINATRVNLASLLHHTNRLAEAEPLLREAVRQFEENHDPQDPAGAAPLNNLAALLEATDRLSEAEGLYRRALALDQKNLGSNHPVIAVRLNNLALLLQSTGREAEAEALLRQAVEIDMRTFGIQHPNSARHLSNLGNILQDSGRSAEAEALLRLSIEVLEQTFGEKSPELAQALASLGTLLRDNGQDAEAEPILRRALAMGERTLGPEHPKLGEFLTSLSAILRDRDRLSESESLLRRALMIDEKSRGPNHPVVARRLENLGAMLCLAGRTAEAIPLFERALSVYADRSDTLHSRYGAVLRILVQLYKDTGNPAASTRLYPELIRFEENARLGNVELAILHNDFGGLLKSLDRLPEAESHYRCALGLLELSATSDLRRPAIVRNNLAVLLEAMGRLEEARSQYHRMLVLLAGSVAGRGDPPESLKVALENYYFLLQKCGLPEGEAIKVLEAACAEGGWPVRLAWLRNDADETTT